MSRSDRALIADLKAAEASERARHAPCAGCGAAIPEAAAIQWRRVGGSFRWHRGCLPADVQARLAQEAPAPAWNPRWSGEWSEARS